MVRKRILNISEYEIINSKITQEIKKLQRRRYTDFLKKGIDALKEKTSRSAWKWIKQHMGKGPEIQNETIKINGFEYTEQNEKLVAWRNHFEKLSLACANDPKTEIKIKGLDFFV